MSKAINIYTVKNLLEPQDWEVVSEAYVNLDTPIEVKCPKGHLMSKSFRELREHLICEECLRANGGQAILHNELPAPKASNVKRRILALDAATVTTGWAVYDDEVLMAYGTFVIKGPDSVERIVKIREWLDSMIDALQVDFVGIEHIQYEYNIEVYRVLANLQGALTTLLYSRGIEYGLAYPSQWRSGFGSNTGDRDRDSKKLAAKQKVQQMYNLVTTEDEADAIGIGYYFVHQQEENTKQ